MSRFHEIVVVIRAFENEDEPFTNEDLGEAVRAALHEVFPVDDGLPVVPKVEVR